MHDTSWKIDAGLGLWLVFVVYVVYTGEGSIVFKNFVDVEQLKMLSAHLSISKIRKQYLFSRHRKWEDIGSDLC